MPSDPSDIAHLLRRAGFAALPSEIAALTPLDWNDAVERVIDPSDAVDAAVGVPDLNPNRDWYARTVDMIWFWTERARTTPAPIVEKMTLFWHGHFCSSMDKVQDHQLMFDQNQLFRTHGTGNFVDLTHRVSVQPAMLAYLDNHRNVLGSPNENFARELMELFTLGVGNYTETDVTESARAWTGHGYDDDRRYRMDASKHDAGSKVFFGRTGAFDGPEIIDLIMTVKRSVVAHFMAAKMWSFFAHPDPSDAIVSSLASAFEPRLEISDLLRAIFRHPEFRSARAKSGLVRSPIEFAVAAMRHTGLQCSEVHPEWYLADMGQEMFRPPNVAGWKHNEYWLNASAVWGKSSFASRLRWIQFEAGVLEETGDREVGAAVLHALDRYGVTSPAASTRRALEEFVVAERATSRWAERSGLLMLPLLTPDFQLA